jgi:hypothetical protein
MRKICFAFLCLSCLAVVACNKQGREVSIESTGCSIEGDIYYGDQKVPLAMVIISPANAPPMTGGASAISDDQGHFKVDNISPGPIKIGVNTEAGKGMMIGRNMAGTDPLAKGGKKATAPKPPVALPKKFFDPATSGLTHTVEKGENKHDIKIENK